MAVEIGAIREAREGRLAMHGLGSCVGLFFSVPGVVGIAAHILLPEPLAGSQPHQEARDVESAVTAMMGRSSRMGLRRHQMAVFVTGGAQVIQFEDRHPESLSIGQRNVDACTAALSARGVTITESWTGGRHPYSVELDVESGRMRVRQVRMALDIEASRRLSSPIGPVSPR